MPFEVERSSTLELNSDAETLLTSITGRLEQQSELVKSVKVLANFSVDKIGSLEHGTAIAQGIVVQVAPEYVMSSEDMSWFHPDIARGRSVFEVDHFISKSQLENIDLDGLQSSIGSYTISSPDEFGTETVQHHIIVDTSVTEMLGSLYRKWTENNVSAGDIDKQWKRMQFDDAYGVKKATELARGALAVEISPSAHQIYSDNTSSVLSDSTSVYFVNHAVKPDSKHVLIKSSSLGGYRMYNATNEAIRFYPSTLGTSEQYYSWSEMSPQNCARIEQSCAWSGNLEFNANVMSGPAVSGKNIRKLEDEYEMSFRDTLSMNAAAFSPSNGIHDSMTPQELSRLHPQASSTKAYITAPIDMDHPVLNHIMQNIQSIQQNYPDFQLFNPNILENGRLKIPKALFKEMA
jgi:hypothetical protein